MKTATDPSMPLGYWLPSTKSLEGQLFLFECVCLFTVTPRPDPGPGPLADMTPGFPLTVWAHPDWKAFLVLYESGPLTIQASICNIP